MLTTGDYCDEWVAAWIGCLCSVPVVRHSCELYYVDSDDGVLLVRFVEGRSGGL